MVPSCMSRTFCDCRYVPIPRCNVYSAVLKSSDAVLNVSIVAGVPATPAKVPIPDSTP